MGPQNIQYTPLEAALMRLREALILGTIAPFVWVMKQLLALMMWITKQLRRLRLWTLQHTVQKEKE